ncbi:putative spermidine/putrescine transport system substrate-binding protein/spermidine/putrescine transport system substrate-binding protein [Rhizobium leguminosarum]|uniref:Spermidine/putrescine transport system substrate-binding protein/spermidine/putrescine transport system substrate-binding protein n=1 Tax=Rhizobium leguminosarum TaxID=384 RepID=A0AAE2SZC6_RHILE|nr:MULTISPECIES: ABC transporter substrate-binding protein [Rhizobium]MBB4293245.1 putative spermidine/putrescine transport system substrate-binding protein/spermidine/putrescine transport system substrate-binding protein [Rhizobium leguminosarum]MBB4299932.1 putative spermidine/putrescine transport system substrate-binding protein/spermidine/putrescine transport system substrate-binding protein [Rhizobium leguminosarum]MBB4311058.1 putative spermidine/putrescine transport system substrate-bindi
MNLIRKFAIGALAAISALPNIASASAAELNLLTWEGYAADGFVSKFEAASGCKVTASYVGSNDDFAAKLAAGGGVYDIITPSLDTVPMLHQAGFVDPIDTAKVDGYDGIYPEFSKSRAVVADGETWAVPLIWGSVSLIYRPDKLPSTPDSIGVLFDPANKGKISLWDDKSAIYWTARYLGYDNVFDLSDEQLEAVKAKLIEQKPLIRKYWASAGELTELMANEEVYVSNAWTGLSSKDVNALNKGFKVVEFTPKEKAEGWMDSMMIAKGSPNTECAYKFISFMQSAEGQCGIAGSTGYFPVNPKAVESCMNADMKKERQVNNVEFVKSLVMWEQPKRLDKYLEVWNAVKAAP